MANNFGSNFLRGFQPNFANMFETSYRMAGIQDEKEQKRQEQEKARQQQLGILSQLVSGMNSQIVPPKINAQGTGFNAQPQELNQQQLTNLIGSASDDTLQRYKLLQGLNAPKQDEYYTPIVGKENKTILRYNKSKGILEDTKQPNPLYEEPLIESSEFVPASSVKGLERWKGYDVEQKVWTDKDGNIIKRGAFGNPMKPTYSTGGDGKSKVYDLNAYKEKLGVYSKRESDLNSKIDKYKTENIVDPEAYKRGEEKIGSYGNAINKAYDKEEIALYNDLLPEAKEYINRNFYQPLKESGAPEDVAYSDRDGIYNDYVSDLTDDYKKGQIKVNLNNYKIPENVDPEEFAKDIEAEVYRSALLWGKLKFRRL